jgi:hypothetical protein
MLVLFRYVFLISISVFIFVAISKVSALIAGLSMDGRIISMCDFRHFSHFWYFGSISLFVCLFFSIGLHIKKFPLQKTICLQFITITGLVLVLPSNYYRFSDHSIGYQFFNIDNLNLETAVMLLIYFSILIWAFDTIIRKKWHLKRRIRCLLIFVLSLLTIIFLILTISYAFTLLLPPVKAHGYYNGFFYHAWEHCISGFGVSLLFAIGLYRKKLSIWKTAFFQYCCLFLLVLVIPYFYSMMQMPAYRLAKSMSWEWVVIVPQVVLVTYAMIRTPSNRVSNDPVIS